MKLRIKNIIIAVCVFTAILACKKKGGDDPTPTVVVPENPAGNDNFLHGCQARTITEMKGSDVASLVEITYSNGLPATIRIDSNGTQKVNLNLDDKGSVRSGTIPISALGTKINVDFTSTNTYLENRLLVKAIFSSKNIPFTQATITNNYIYDASDNLTLLIRTTTVTGLYYESTMDSIVYTGYTNARPRGFIKYSKDIKAGELYKISASESYEYDSQMNRIKIIRNGVLREETIFSQELFPGKIAYLMDLDGNPNYGNKDQDLNFMQSQKIYKNCSSGTIYDMSNVTSLKKAGSCITIASLSDATAICGAAVIPSSRSYVIVY